VSNRLGGGFDYGDFEKDCASLIDQAQDAYRKFKSQKLVVPEPDPEIKELLEKVRKMKFSGTPTGGKDQGGNSQRSNPGVKPAKKNEVPSYLKSIITEPMGKSDEFVRQTQPVQLQSNKPSSFLGTGVKPQQQQQP
jgi:hypothetical protein